MNRRVAAVLALSFTLTACGAPPRVSTPDPPAAERHSAAEMAVPPTAIRIPDLNAESTLIPLGLDPQGALEVPPLDQPMQAGWFAGEDVERLGDEIVPGEVGPAVIAAHVNGAGRPGLFARLDQLYPRAQVAIDRADGSTIAFEVYRVQTYEKIAFPTAEVYGDTDAPELRLITCGGEFDRATGHYVRNVVAYARVVDA